MRRAVYFPGMAGALSIRLKKMEKGKGYCKHDNGHHATTVYTIPRDVKHRDAQGNPTSMICGECEKPLAHDPETMTTVVQLCCKECGILCFFCLAKKNMTTWKHVESEECNYDFVTKSHALDTRRYDACSDCWARRLGDVSPDVMFRNFLCPEVEFGPVLNADPRDVQNKIAGIKAAALTLMRNRDTFNEEKKNLVDAYREIECEWSRLHDEWYQLDRERRMFEEDRAHYRSGQPYKKPLREHKDTGHSKKIKREDLRQ